MRRLAVINQKGGVGKTTTAANLGAAMGARGRRVLLIDLDPQAHLTMCYGIEPDQGDQDKPNVYDVLTDSVPLDRAIVNVRPNVDIVPAYIDLAGAETELVNAVGREVILRDAINTVSESYDIALIDCPPSLGLLTINALVASEEVLIPLQAHFLALQGLSKLLDTVTLVKRRITPIIRISGIVFCMFDGGTRLASEVVEDVQQFLDTSRDTDCAWAGARIYSTRIRRNIKLAESPSYGQTVLDYAPTSHGAADYISLAGEILAEWFVDETTLESPESADGIQNEGSADTGDAAASAEVPTTVELTASPKGGDGIKDAGSATMGDAAESPELQTTVESTGSPQGAGEIQGEGSTPVSDVAMPSEVQTSAESAGSSTGPTTDQAERTVLETMPPTAPVRTVSTSQ